MTEAQEWASKFQQSVESKLGVKPYSDQDAENFRNLINHWIRDKSSSGRAAFTSIPNDIEIPVEFVQANLESANELIEVRKHCKNCQVSETKECLYDKKQWKRARKWEEEKGLDEGTLTPSTLRSRVCIKNCDKPGSKGPSPVYRNMLMRPSLIYRHETVYYAYGACPVKGETFQK